MSEAIRLVQARDNAGDLTKELVVGMERCRHNWSYLGDEKQQRLDKGK